MTPDLVAKEVLQEFIARECKGKPKKIAQSYIEREMERRAEPQSRGVD
jgi:hypothetical protein